MTKLGKTEVAGKLSVFGADLPEGVESAVVTEHGRRIVLLNSGLDRVGRDVALFLCLAGLGDHGMAVYAPPPR